MNSMTGFGAATAPLGGSSIRVEISGVNRKQAEIAVALPRAGAAWKPPCATPWPRPFPVAA